MKKIAVVYHSGFGHTEVIARHIHKGAQSVDGVESEMLQVENITDDPSILNDRDAIIMGSPTYMGSVSAPFKAFMDATSKLWYQQAWKNKIAAGFTNSHSLSGDKLNTLIQLGIFAGQHGMIWVGQAEPNGSPDGQPGKADAINRIGSFFGLMAQSENEPTEVTPPTGDRGTAELFGKRVATLTKSFDLSKVQPDVFS